MHDPTTSALSLRPVGSSDVSFLRLVLYHAIHVPAGAPRPPRNIVASPALAVYVDGWGRPGDLGVVAAWRGQPCGAAWLRLWPEEPRGYGFVDPKTPELAMAMLPGHRGRGHGTRLLQHLLAIAEPRFAKVSLSVAATNPARRLYARAGFVALGPSAAGSIIMAIDLAGS